MNKLCFLLSIVHAVWLVVTPHANMSSDDPILQALEVGFRPNISDTKYLDVITKTLDSSLPEAESLWNREYGARNLSWFVLQHDKYEERVFAYDSLQNEKNEKSLLFLLWPGEACL